jgi:hypothetical protein
VRAARYAIALIVVVDVLIAVAQMQQAIIERASFRPPSVTTYGQYVVVMSAATANDIDLYVRDPAGHIAWYGGLQAGPLSLEHDYIPGSTDPVSAGVHERTIVRESTEGEYVANVHYYQGSGPVQVTVELWDLRGHDRLLLTRRLTVRALGEQRTAFRWRLNRAGDYAGSSRLPADLLRQAGAG